MLSLYLPASFMKSSLNVQAHEFIVICKRITVKIGYSSNFTFKHIKISKLKAHAGFLIVGKIYFRFEFENGSKFDSTL